MGGSWEQLIRSVKTTLRCILREHLPSEEMLSTLLVETEAIVNSRPLTFVSLDSHDEEALTPNHFLMGCSSPCSYPGNFKKEDIVSKRKWRATQQLINHFWKRWVHEYLPMLTRRVKWLQSSNPIVEGSIVIIADPLLPRGCWPKGRVIKTYPGKDGEIRVVDVKTQFGVFKRPVTKICLLDLQ